MSRARPAPNVWKTVRLGDAFRQITRRNDRGVSRVLTASGQHGLIDQTEFFNRSIAGKSLENYFLLERGEFAYNRSLMQGYPFGAIKRLDRYPVGVVSALYLCFATKNDLFWSDFAAQLFDSGLLNTELAPIAKIGARAHGLLNVTPQEFLDMQVPCPPPPEQRKIAAILSSVDVAIERTEALIAKLRDLKTAMMQDLLTKGIGHTRFKDSPLGRIPVEWEVVSLEQAVKKERPITYGIVQTGPHVVGGVPCVRVVDLVKPDLCIGDMIRTTPEISEQYGRTILQRNDIMFALRGEIGHVVQVPEALVGANLTRGVALISPNNKATTGFLLWALRSGSVRTEIADQVNGSALQEVPLGGLRQVRVPIPPTDEQERIAGLLDSIEMRVASAARRLSGLGTLKKALMQDLLTGRVRVKSHHAKEPSI